MTDPRTLLGTLSRPSLMMKAARHAVRLGGGAAATRRSLGEARPHGGAHVLGTLLDLEQGMEDARRDRCAGYSPARHLDLMTALLHEAGARLGTAAEDAERPTTALRRAV